MAGAIIVVVERGRRAAGVDEEGAGRQRSAVIGQHASENLVTNDRNLETNQGATGLRPLCRTRKKMAFWSAGPKCGNYFQSAESGRPCDHDLTVTN